MLRSFVVPAAATALFVSAAFGQDSPMAFTGARILPVDSPPIASGTLLIQGGRIVAVGATAAVAIPAGAVRVDLTGRTIVPGLVCSHSHIGAVAGADQSGPIQPEVRALDSINARDPGIQKAQAGGITTVNVMPGSGHLLSGQCGHTRRPSGDRCAAQLAGLCPALPHAPPSVHYLDLESAPGLLHGLAIRLRDSVTHLKRDFLQGRRLGDVGEAPGGHPGFRQDAWKL